MKTTLFLLSSFLFSTSLLAEINANYNNGNVEISWSQTNNYKTSYFLIERSNDGRYFTEIYKVKGSNIGVEYFEIDYHPPIKTAYYKVKQIDTNGDISFSETVLVKNYEKLNFYGKPKSFLKGYKNRDVLVVLKDKKGGKFYLKMDITAYKKELLGISKQITMKADSYTVIASSDDVLLNKKIIIIGNDNSNNSFLSQHK